MQELGKVPYVNLKVLYCDRSGMEEFYDPGFGINVKWDQSLVGGYSHVFLRNLGSGLEGGFWGLINISLISEIQKHQTDVLVVHGYDHLTNIVAMTIAKILGIRVMHRGVSQDLNTRPKTKRVAKQLLLRPLLRAVDKCLYVGNANREFYRSMGVPEEKLSFVPYAVDNDRFRDQWATLKVSRRELRENLGVFDDRPIILVCGKLIARKRPHLVLGAFQRLREEIPCALVFAGDGPLRAELEATIRSRAIPDVRITGFLNQGELANAYGAADLSVLASSFEAWGLVINEAMNFGLPVVVGDKIGCGSDLVIPGYNGDIFQDGDESALVDALRPLLHSGEIREQYGLNSLRKIDGYSLQAAAKAIAEIAEEAGHREGSGGE